MKKEKAISSHALAAKQIRAELKKEFPSVKFRVIARTFSGGDSIRIEWKNSIPAQQVDNVVNKYAYGKFDGMTDYYDCTNVRSDISQVKYISIYREITEDIYNIYFDKFKVRNDGWDKLSSIDEASRNLLEKWGTWTARNYIYRKLVDVDLTTI